MPDSVAVLFSGGSDSTLAAAIGAERFSRVWLVTYRHGFMMFHDKIGRNVERLRRAYPGTEILTHHERISRSFAQIYFNGLGRRLLRYRTMTVPWLCASCKLAMHLATIEFCSEHRVAHVYCGAHEESASIFPAQMEPVIEELQRLYRTHGITYETPVYHAGRTDRRLKDMGIIDDGNLKDQHLVYSTQHTCPLGVALHAHSRLYYTRIHGRSRYEERAHAMVRETIEERLSGGREGVE